MVRAGACPGASRTFFLPPFGPCRHSGLSVVWDLKLKKPVISFQDPNNKTQRNSVITWNPEAATEVLVASADDRSPVLQIWDLRNAMMPARQQHTRTTQP